MKQDKITHAQLMERLTTIIGAFNADRNPTPSSISDALSEALVQVANYIGNTEIRDKINELILATEYPIGPFQQGDGDFSAPDK